MDSQIMDREERISKHNRIVYDVEAMVEYFISLLVTDAFLATLLTRSGVSDSATGIITQLASLGFIAQLVSVFLRKGKNIRRWVTGMCLACQMMYVSLYLLPLLGMSPAVATVVFAVLFLGGHILQNVVSPYKLTWLMSFVPANIRGSFTAGKEIMSLAGGMIFTYVMGTVVDHFTDAGQDGIGFLICGITIFVIAIAHLITILLIKDHETGGPESYGGSADGGGLIQAVKSVASDKNIVKLFLVDMIWHFGAGISTSFYGVYKINDLGFSLRYISILSIMYSVSRMLFSKFLGRYADRKSWVQLLEMCFMIAAVGYFVNIFTVPSNGRYMFAIYYCIYAVSMAGINSGLMNITFDYVKPESYASTLGIKYAFGGLSAFVASLIGGVIVHNVQANGNQIFGFTVYAQQILTLITFITIVLLIVYLRKYIYPMKRLRDETDENK